MKTVKELRIHQKSLALTKEIYDMINKYTKLSRDYSLCDQIKRASVSVVANIAEGYLRTSKLSKNYLRISMGSSNEVITLLVVVQTIYGINTNGLQKEYEYLARQINAFLKSFY